MLIVAAIQAVFKSVYQCYAIVPKDITFFHGASDINILCCVLLLITPSQPCFKSYKDGKFICYFIYI
jgi:hypothetical protein